MDDISIFKIGKFQFSLTSILIVSILILSFSISFFLRIIPIEYGWELNEFDPFFNFRATAFIIENGLESYFNWNDSLSWYPSGRDVSNNSQVVLHIFAAISYKLFGFGQNLYDFTIIFPVVIGSLSSVIIFALVRVICGTSAGLFASLLFSVALPILLRGSMGWFKSEPLGLFLSLLGIYFFLSGLNNNNLKISLVRLFLSGFILTLSVSAWGGNQFFFLVIGIFILTLSFFKKDHRVLLYSIPIFVMSSIIPSLFIERLSSTFYILQLISLVIPTIIMVIGIIIQKKSQEKVKIRNNLYFVSLIIILFSTILIFSEISVFDDYSFRYLNAVNPFLTTTNPLTDSISEHQTTSIENSFLFHSILLIFSGIGIWIILEKQKFSTKLSGLNISFILILGVLGVYMGSTFIRLEVFTSISLILLSSIFLAIITNHLFVNKFKKNFIKISLLSGIIMLLIFSIIFPFESSIFNILDTPAVILNGGTNHKISSNDWKEALVWIDENTPKDSVIASWWDYGYWIQTIGNRASLADNSTLYDKRIQTIAKIFFNEPNDAWKLLNELEVNYFIIFVSGERLNVDSIDGSPVYVLRGGGDESKKFWFGKIANIEMNKYFMNDNISGTEEFWNNTFLGKSIPFEVIGYVNPRTSQTSENYIPGWIPVYEKIIKFDENDPFQLVYSSPSFNATKGKILTTVLVYQLNNDYILPDR